MKKPSPPRDKARELLDADVETFLRKGGTITQIDKGVSAYPGNGSAVTAARSARGR